MERIIVHRNGLPDLDLVKRGERSLLNASLTRELLSSDFVSLKVKSSDILDVKVNDTIIIDGRTYRMNIPAEWLQIGEQNYQYDLRFDGIMYDLIRTIFLNADGIGFSTTPEFALVGNIEHFLTAILNNVTRFNVNWEKGTFTNGETKTITFSNENCLQALQKVCTEFGLEFRIDIVSGINKINVGSFGTAFSFSFSYGKGEGLYSLALKNVEEKNIINRLYVFGGSDNLPIEYRNYADKLKIPVDDYLEDTAMISEMGLIEGIANFPDIFPKRKGIISTVVDKLTFTDDSMNFDLNEKDADGKSKFLLPDTTAKISFLTGSLAGYEFEIVKNGYNHTEKSFKIIQQLNNNNFKIPDDNAAYQFAVGDEYVLLDIIMPPTYISDAEAELLVKGTEEFEKLKKAVVAYELKISPLYMKSIAIGSMQIPFDIGDYIKIVHEKLNVDKLIRITSIEKNLLKDGDYTVNVADDFKINDVRQLIYDVKNIQTILQLTGILNITKSTLGYKTTEELKNLVFDPDGYFEAENIRPNSIETNMLSVGAKSQQLSCSVTFSLNELGNPNKLSASMGQLYSQTMEKIWNIGAQEYVVPDNSFRYVYAKCQKNGDEGIMYLSDEQILFNSDVNYYYFLIGVLHSVVLNVRIMSITIGTTTINGGLIRTGIISSLDGSTYFNLNTNEIKGRIEFTDDSLAYGQISGGGENLIYEENNYYNFIPDIDRYFDKNLKYIFSVDIKNTFNLDKATIFIIGKKNNVYSVISEKEITFDTTVQNSISRASIPLEFIINDYQRIFCKVIGANDEDFETEKPKLELGNVSSDYSLAQYVISKKISEIEKNTNWYKTTISGNVVTTGTLFLGNYETGTNAGITGEGTKNDVFLWAGSNYGEKENAPIRFYRNGKLHATNAHIEGYIKATDGEFTGKLTATSGWFGTGSVGFEIFDLGIKTLDGYIVCGDYISAEKSYVQIVGKSVGGSMINIKNDVTSPYGKTGLYVDVSGSSSSNVALQISSGQIRVKDDATGTIYTAFTGTKIISGVSLKFVKGLLVQ